MAYNSSKYGQLAIQAMSLRKLLFYLLASTALLALAGCDAASEGDTAPNNSPATSSSSESSAGVSLPTFVGKHTPAEVSSHTLDARMAKVAEEVEGFAGFFRSSEGEPVILLTSNISRASAAVSRVVPRLKSIHTSERFANFIGKQQPVIRRVEHDYVQLKEWKDQAASVLSLDGVTYLDLDEKGNGITVGIESEDVGQKVLAELEQKGVPKDAIKLNVVGYVQEESTLDDRFRPAEGGYQIGPRGCTLGYNGKDASGNAYFVTNSHCTQAEATLDGGPMYQDAFSDPSDRVGVEVGDPPYSSEYDGCPPGEKCRYSDAALIKYDSGIRNRNFIARTKERVSGGTEGNPDVRGTLDIVDTEFQTFGKRPTSVQGIEGAVYMGQELDRVGQTSGWTYGEVYETCVSVPKANSNITMLCQAKARYGSDSGDSGSPVFEYQVSNLSGIVNRAYIRGIHWGGFDNSPRAVFSTANWVENEVGELEVTGLSPFPPY